jgi:hypothetical protein
MNARKPMAARHDRGLFLRFTPSFALTGWVIMSPGGPSSWFRPLELDAGQSGLELMNRWFLGVRRFRPIPVVDSTKYPATKHLRPWGHVVRI